MSIFHLHISYPSKETWALKEFEIIIVHCIDTAKKITTTPLLEYLKLRKQEKQRLRDEKREERRRRDIEKRRTRDDPVISKVE